MNKKQARKHPTLIVIKINKKEGYGFGFLNEKDFKETAQMFFTPIEATIEERNKDAMMNKEELKLLAGVNFILDIMNDSMGREVDIDGIRWASAGCIMQTPWEDDEVPLVVVIEKAGDELTIREGTEYLKQDGYPKVIIIGSKSSGGGKAHLFSTRKAYNKRSEQAPTDDMWLPQIIAKAYAQTTSVMYGHPTVEDDEKTSISVACYPEDLESDYKVMEIKPSKRA